MGAAVADLAEVIVTLVDVGDERLNGGDARAANAAFQEAWQILPLPKLDHPHAALVLGALADAAFVAGNFAEARRVLEEALRTGLGAANPALHLRRGQVAFELEEDDIAVVELLRACELAGAEIFDGEAPKYLRLLHNHVAALGTVA